MKALVIILFSIIASSYVLGLSAEQSLERNTKTIDKSDGWFVPHLNGSLKWVTKEEGAKFERQLSMARFGRKVKVAFYLYTQKNRDYTQKLSINDKAGLSATNFNSSNPTRIIIHGWQNDFTSDVNDEIGPAFLDVMDCNVISVDWHGKAMSYNYMNSKNSVPKVGKQVAQMIDFLVTEGKMSLDDLYVIGHSLGAHVSGVAGKHVTTGKIHTIIGLDPAWPMYLIDTCTNRLCAGDAQYVEVVHTNGGLLGFLEPVGNADFYANGGMLQPGCGIDVGGMCSHSRSHLYYAESIRENGFESRKCSNWMTALLGTCDKKSVAQLGNSLNFGNLEGYYYTPVNDNPLYGQPK
ncbi:phospholipase A1-like [Episyrphus balteatus]|uniref:phospholipase A1-like n=1 Tax=Episyrphus balteatus TaxID=286459 RepID=UPI0024860DD2|nr:phospholipase A1-like [Episyrphus balteatus]